MTRSLLASLLLASTTLSAQTYFYIDEVNVDPQPATTQDVVSIDLVGNFASTGSYIVSATANVTGFLVSFTVIAGDNGGLTVLVPHTETIVLGQLPAGTYDVAVSLGSQNVLFPPNPVSFIVEGVDLPCDSLDIDVQWHAFSDTAIVVHVLNASTQTFDYPGFILFDANGDTLAKETVNFFGIPSENWHLLVVHDDATIPSEPFEGTLELWTGFTTELACTWNGTWDLCPPEPCANLLVTVENLGGALAIGTYNWAIYSEDFQEMGTGQMSMTGNVQSDSDPVCLPPGRYTLDVSPNDPPTGGNPVFSVNTSWNIVGPSQQVSWSLPVPMPFDFYLPCVDGTNAIAESDVTVGLVVSQGPNGITLRTSDGSSIGELRLLDVQGRILTTYRSNERESTFAHDVADGVYVLVSRFGAIKTVLGR
jgi:hypothetical protein